MGFEKSGGAFFFNGGDFAHSTDIALLKPLNIDGKSHHSMSFDPPKVRPCQKVGHDFCLVIRNPHSQIRLFTEKFQIIKGYALGNIPPHPIIPPDRNHLSSIPQSLPDA
jgi:hypothetical protein